MNNRLPVRVDLRNDGSGNIEVYPGKTKLGNVDQFHRISVYCRNNDFGKAGFLAEVNWGGHGAVPADEAFAYSEGIRYAAEIARELESRMEGKTQPDIRFMAYIAGLRHLTEEEHTAYWKEREDK